jgi:hypothetical protein
LANESFLKSEVPSPEVVSVIAIQEDWRQRSSSSDAWEVPIGDELPIVLAADALTQLAIADGV